MTKNTIFVLLLILFDGLAVAWGVWEFWSARPSKKAAQPTLDESAERPGHPEG